jgi:hypothetical protein
MGELVEEGISDCGGHLPGTATRVRNRAPALGRLGSRVPSQDPGCRSPLTDRVWARLGSFSI